MRAILTFHSVDPSGSVLSIEAEALRSLVRAIRNSGHEIVPLAEILDRPEAPRRVALTFDDGMRSLYESARPVLSDEGAPATLFLTTDRLGGDNRWPSLPEQAPTMSMMSWDQVGALVEAGWSVEAHTGSHPDLRTLSDDAIHEELERGNEAIEKRLGERAERFAYPYGYWDERVEAIVAKHYRYAVTVDMAELPVRIDAPHRVPRIETYYFRSPAIHAHFGTALFDGYLWARTKLRALRGQ